jgi:6-phosphofructokinase 1
MAGAADRCIIPEHNFDMEKLTELLSSDRNSNPSKYSTVLVSEGALDKSRNMIYKNEESDMYGHKKLGGIGDIVAEKLRELSPKYNNGKRINTITQRLGYLVRSGSPDAVDSIVPMVFGNIAFDLILENTYGRLVCLRNGEYDNVPIEIITSKKKQIDIAKFYNTERLRPTYKKFTGMPFFLITNDF